MINKGGDYDIKCYNQVKKRSDSEDNESEVKHVYPRIDRSSDTLQCYDYHLYIHKFGGDNFLQIWENSCSLSEDKKYWENHKIEEGDDYDALSAKYRKWHRTLRKNMNAHFDKKYAGNPEQRANVNIKKCETEREFDDKIGKVIFQCWSKALGMLILYFYLCGFIV